MIHSRLGIAVSLALAGGVASASASPLEVVVANVRSNAGQLAVCVFAGPNRFPDCAAGERLATALAPARSGAMRFAFDVPPAVLAVAVVHDENGNGRLDSNLLGIPREGVGVSNNPTPRRGPPLHRDAAFTLPPAGATVRIELLYP